MIEYRKDTRISNTILLLTVNRCIVSVRANKAHKHHSLLSQYSENRDCWPVPVLPGTCFNSIVFHPPRVTLINIPANYLNLPNGAISIIRVHADCGANKNAPGGKIHGTFSQWYVENGAWKSTNLLLQHNTSQIKWQVSRTDIERKITSKAQIECSVNCYLLQSDWCLFTVSYKCEQPHCQNATKWNRFREAVTLGLLSGWLHHFPEVIVRLS